MLRLLFTFAILALFLGLVMGITRLFLQLAMITLQAWGIAIGLIILSFAAFRIYKVCRLNSPNTLAQMVTISLDVEGFTWTPLDPAIERYLQTTPGIMFATIVGITWNVLTLFSLHGNHAFLGIAWWFWGHTRPVSEDISLCISVLLSAVTIAFTVYIASPTDAFRARLLARLNKQLHKDYAQRQQANSAYRAAIHSCTSATNDVNATGNRSLIADFQHHNRRLISGELGSFFLYGQWADFQAALDSIVREVGEVRHCAIASLPSRKNTPVPTTTGLSPTSATVPGNAFRLTVNGTNFVNGVSTVRWNGSNRTTTYVSATQLIAFITAADVATAGIATVTVFNATPGGGISAGQTFTINNPPQKTESLEDKAYRTLDIPPTATPEQIRTAYGDMCQFWHPDKCGDNPRRLAMANAKMKDINEAYDVLRDKKNLN